jgi:hypothetical protein
VFICVWGGVFVCSWGGWGGGGGSCIDIFMSIPPTQACHAAGKQGQQRLAAGGCRAQAGRTSCPAAVSLRWAESLRALRLPCSSSSRAPSLLTWATGPARSFRAASALCSASCTSTHSMLPVCHSIRQAERKASQKPCCFSFLLAPAIHPPTPGCCSSFLLAPPFSTPPAPRSERQLSRRWRSSSAPAPPWPAPPASPPA